MNITGPLVHDNLITISTLYIYDIRVFPIFGSEINPSSSNTYKPTDYT